MSNLEPTKIATNNNLHELTGSWSADLSNYTAVRGQIQYTTKDRTLDTSNTNSIRIDSNSFIGPNATTIYGDNGPVATITSSPFKITQMSSGSNVVSSSSTATITITSIPWPDQVTINPNSGIHEWKIEPKIDGTWGIAPITSSPSPKRPDEENWSENINPESKSIKTIDVFVDRDELKLGVVDEDGKAVLIDMDRNELSKLIGILQSALIRSDKWNDYYKSLEGKENINPTKDEQLPLDQDIY